MSSAPRYIPHYTVADYMQWKGDWQLIDGVPIAMTPSPFGRHERIVANLVYELMRSFDENGCDCQAYAGLDWIVSADTVVRPDVMVVCGSQPERHLEAPPDLVVQILSTSTKTQDRVTKRDLYHEYRVPFYLIIDPETNSIEVLQSTGGGYSPLPVSNRVEITLPSGCRLQIPVERVLRS